MPIFQAGGRDSRAEDRPAFGDGLGRCFELHDPPALCVELAGRSAFAVTLLNCDGGRAGLMPEIPAQEAYLATLHLSTVRHHETWLGGRPALARGYQPGALQILDLRQEVATYLAGPWDALSFYLPCPLVRAVARSHGQPFEHLACEPGIVDPVLTHLSAAAIALLLRPQPPGRALMRRLALATCAHLVHAYGVAPASRARTALTAGPAHLLH